MSENYKEKYGSLNSVLRFLQPGSSVSTNANDLISQLNAECSKLTNCRVASFFLLNQTTFEFVLTGTYSSLSSFEARKVFGDLIEAGFLSETLKSGKSTQKQISFYEVAYLIPIKSNEMVFSFLLLIIEKKIILSEETQLVLSALTLIFTLKYFQLSVSNKNTSKESKGKTELIEQINNLKQGTEDLHKIIDSIHEGIFLIDKSSKLIQDANQTAVNLICTPKENLIGKEKDNFFLFFDNNVFKDEIITKEEALLITAEGNAVPIIYATSDILIDKYEYQIISFLDISERKMMEDKIQQSRFELEHRVEERTKELGKINYELKNEILEREKAQQENLKLLLAVQQTNSLITITDLEAKIEYANEAICAKTGYTLAELLGKTPAIFKGKGLDGESYKASYNAVRSGEQWTGEHMMKKKNGELIWVYAHISPIKNPAGKIINYLGVQEDITERKLAEEQLLQAKAKVERAEKAKSSLLANMSHEFRTPLISILGFSELLEFELTEKEQIEMIHAVQSGGKRLLNSLENILLLSHLESSNLKFAMKKINVISLLRSSVALYSQEAKQKSLTLEFDSAVREIIITSEEKYLSLIINNLLDNAIKFTINGGIKINAGYSFENNIEYALISVQDTGIGIAPEDQSQIFEAFRQASEGYNRNYEGFGLGLTIAQKTIHLMNGKITVQSTPNIGSIFTIWIPTDSSNKINLLLNKLFD